MQNLLAHTLRENSTFGINYFVGGLPGVYFNTTNEDRVQTSSSPMIGVDDIISLPKGQAFMLVNGGEVYKIRVPIPLNNKRKMSI